MKKIILLFSHNTLARKWNELAHQLRACDIELVALSQNTDIDWEAFIKNEIPKADVLYLEIIGRSPIFSRVIEVAKKLPFVLTGSMDAKAELGNDHSIQAEIFNRYVENASSEQLEISIFYLLQEQSKALGNWNSSTPEVAMPEKPQLVAIADPRIGRTFDSIETYLCELTRQTSIEVVNDSSMPLVPLLYGRRYWISGDTQMISTILENVQQAGFIPLPVYCDFALGNKINEPDHPVAKLLLSCKDQIIAMLNLAFSSPAGEARPDRLFHAIGKPVIQLIREYSFTEEEWLASDKTLMSMTYNFSVAQPEVFGSIEPHLIACNEIKRSELPQGETSVAKVVCERMDRLVKRLKRWHFLQSTVNTEKKICIMLHNAPCKAVEATLACAAGLDAAQSCVDLMNRMKAEGYDVQGIPENGAKLLHLIQERRAYSEFRWTNVESIVANGGVIARIDETTYNKHFNQLNSDLKDKINQAWEPFPAKAMVHENSDGEPVLLITGLHFGNITVMIEPKRGCWGPKCDGEVCRILHQPDIPPTHHWMATAWYIQDHYDAIIQMGAESSMDYLPGKPVALSQNCFPDLSLGELPRVFPYIMDSIGEGLLAKRRGKGVMISHLTAPVRRMGDQMEYAESLLEEHRQLIHARQNNQMGQVAELQKTICRQMIDAGFITTETSDQEVEEQIKMLPRQIQRMRQRVIEVGKHVLGRVPDHEQFELYLNEAAETKAFDAATLRNKLDLTYEELNHVIDGLNGQFIPSGQAGPLTCARGNLLPTGRNFYGMDIRSIPTSAAWKVGVDMGQKLLQKYLTEEGGFPESIGVTLWSSDAFMAEGELTSQCLWLIGCEPIWSVQGKVNGIKVIPREHMRIIHPDGHDIERPRIDVVVRMSGVVRDLLEPVYMLIDDAITAVSDLNEGYEFNFISKHVKERLKELNQGLQGIEPPALRRLATGRLFTDRDGSYGAGVGLAVDASAWKEKKDLAEAYVNWTGGLCGRGMNQVVEKTGMKRVMKEFSHQMKGINVAYQRSISSKYDALSISCYTGYQGGMAVTQQAMGGKSLKLYWGDSQNGPKSEIRDLKDEIDLGLTSRFLDPQWLEEKMKEGYSGATDLSSLVNTLFAWSATADVVQKQHFDLVTRKLVQDVKVRQWFMENNVYALEEVTRRLLEAEARKMWEADENSLDAIREASLEIEGDIEDRMGAVTGEFQGSSVDIKTQDDVNEWNWENVISIKD